MKLRYSAMVALIFAVCLPACATEIDFNLSNPAITIIRQRMDGRAPKIRSYLQRGFAGESSTGGLEPLQLSTLDLSGQKALLDTLAAENDDRQAFFRELALVYHLDSVAPVGVAYANVRYALAEPGFRIQDQRSGKWVAKRDFGK